MDLHNQAAFIPIIAPLIASSLIMMSKMVKNYSVKKHMIKISFLLAIIISFVCTFFLMVSTYNHGPIDIVVGGYQKGLGISYSFTFFISTPAIGSNDCKQCAPIDNNC